MTLEIVDLLKNHPELVLFVLLALSYLIGRIKIGWIRLQQFSINLTTGINHQIKSRQGFCGLHT